MRLKKGRFEHFSREEAIALLNEIEGPLLDMALGQASGDVCSGDVVGEVFLALQCNPRLQLLFPTAEEIDSWERFVLKRGDGPEEIGEFVYGPEKNPWRRHGDVPGSVDFLTV